tara:strand:+ start:226 stop:495 length:270 start_codon:yes stop_codon:yes gene_type:complete
MKKSTKLSNQACVNRTKEKSLYLLNDHYNDFEHVINCLVALCDHSELQAEQCALLTHYRGSCEIASGKIEELLYIKEDLAIYGLDVDIF